MAARVGQDTMVPLPRPDACEARLASLWPCGECVASAIGTTKAFALDSYGATGPCTNMTWPVFRAETSAGRSHAMTSPGCRSVTRATEAQWAKLVVPPGKARKERHEVLGQRAGDRRLPYLAEGIGGRNLERIVNETGAVIVELAP